MIATKIWKNSLNFINLKLFKNFINHFFLCKGDKIQRFYIIPENFKSNERIQRKRL